MKAPDQDRNLTPDEAALTKGVSRTTIYSAITEGRLPRHRVLNRLAIRQTDLESWIPAPHSGRPKGMPVSDEARSRMGEAQKRRWARARKVGSDADSNAPSSQDGDGSVNKEEP